MRCQCVLFCDFATACGVVTTIQYQMPLFLSTEDWHSNDNPFKHCTQHFAVVTVGTTERNGEGNAFGIGQKVALGS